MYEDYLICGGRGSSSSGGGGGGMLVPDDNTPWSNGLGFQRHDTLR